MFDNSTLEVTHWDDSDIETSVKMTAIEDRNGRKPTSGRLLWDIRVSTKILREAAALHRCVRANVVRVWWCINTHARAPRRWSRRNVCDAIDVLESVAGDPNITNYRPLGPAILDATERSVISRLESSAECATERSISPLNRETSILSDYERIPNYSRTLFERVSDTLDNAAT